MKFDQIYKYFISGHGIKRNNFSYKIVQIDNKKIVLISYLNQDGTTEIFYNDSCDAFFSLDDIIAEDWKFI